MRRDRNGNLNPHIGARHIRQHEEFMIRAAAMMSLRKGGLTDHQIAQSFNTTRANVYRILRRYEQALKEDAK